MMFAYMGEHNIYIPTRENVRLNDYQARVIPNAIRIPCGLVSRCGGRGGERDHLAGKKNTV